MDAATREHIRWEIDERRRREIQLGPPWQPALAIHCWTAAEGDPLEALALAIDRVAARTPPGGAGPETGATG